MTNTIQAAGRTFTLDEEYEHPVYGRVKFVAFNIDWCGFFRDETGDGLELRYDSFPLPEPETVTVKMPMRNSGKEPFASFTFTFTHDEARAAIKALQDVLPGDDVWVRLSRGDAGHFRQDSRAWAGCEACRRVGAAIAEALER